MPIGSWVTFSGVRPSNNAAVCVDPWTLVECGDAVAVEPGALEEPRVDEEPRHALRHPLRLLRQLRLQHLIKQTDTRYRDRLKGDSHVNALLGRGIQLFLSI